MDFIVINIFIIVYLVILYLLIGINCTTHLRFLEMPRIIQTNKTDRFILHTSKHISLKIEGPR